MINKKIVLSLLTLSMLVVAASAGTWAYFSSTVDTQNNIISTGTITLHADGAAASTTPFNIGPIVPGDSVTNFAAGHLINDGTVDGDLTGVIHVAVAPGTALPEDMVITTVIGTQTVVLHVGDNVVPTQRLNSGANVPITVSIDYPNADHEQAGQGVQITSSGTFVLKSNPAYTSAI